MLNSNNIFGSLKLQQLWTNPSPTAPMGDYTITIPETDSEYLIILFNDGSTIKTALLPYVVNMLAKAETNYQDTSPRAGASVSRFVRIISKTQLKVSIARFSEDYTCARTTDDKGSMIPYQVLGLKL